MSFIKEDIDIEQCFNEYSQNGIVSIENIFHPHLAKDFYDYITNTEEGDWNAAFPNVKKEGESFLLKREEGNLEKISSMQNENLSKLNNNQFCYRFDRLNTNHKSECGCVICGIRENFLKSSKMKSLISQITKRDDLNEEFESFISRYRKNDYLSLHSDTVEDHETGLSRHVAIIIHFAKDWKPWYGGNLVICDNNDMVRKTFVPKFNSLTIMDVENYRMPHFVSEIANGLDKSRYAISYWM